MSKVLAVGALLVAFGAAIGPMTSSTAEAQPIWCSPDGLDEFGQPFPPRPYWAQFDEVPDYTDVMNNFNVSKSITLMVSVLEKGVSSLQDLTSDASTPDVDGFCLCNCGQDAGWWIDYIVGSLKDNLINAVNDAKDNYINALVAKLQAAKATILDTIPAFKSDVETAIINACNAAAGTECDLANPLDTLGDIADQAATVVKDELESIFNAEKDQVVELLTGAGSPYALGMEEIQNQLTAVGDAAATAVLKLNFKPLGAELSTLMSLTGDLIGDVVDSAKALAATYTFGDVVAIKDQVLDALETWMAGKFTDSAAAYAQLEADVEAAVQARVDAIKFSIDDLYLTALNYSGPFDAFKTSFITGIVGDLTNVGGCYGTSKRSECTTDVGAFCEGTTAGTILSVDVPVWLPTDVYKDGKTALKFALKHVGFLEKVNSFLQDNAPSWMATAGSWIDALKNAQEVFDKLAEYVNTFTDGFHLGTYSSIRPDLHMCVGYGGHGAFAEVFSFNIADHTVSGGASYASFNLTKNRRAQFRSGGFAVDIDGKGLQLAPGISLNTQMDGFRLWDKKYPFGLGRNADGSPWNALNPGNWSFSTNAVETLDVFSLVDQSQLEALCPGGSGPCNLTVANFLYNGYYPIDYTASATLHEWPRAGLEWENHTDPQPTAIFGAGLNLDFEMKQYRWDIEPAILLFAPPPVWLTPWLSLDAGVSWLYRANELRDTLQEKLNVNLSAADQLTTDDFRRDKLPATSASFNGEPFQAPDVTEDMGTTAFVEPRAGADLDIGIKIAKFLKIGITVSIYLGLRVDVGGYGGVLDLNRALLDTLAASNPPGDDCHVIIEEKKTEYCSNTLYQKDDPCGDDKDCIDLSPGSPQEGPYSKGDYSCGDGMPKCTEHGYCLGADDQVLAHDITREECEGKDDVSEGGCTAIYIKNPCNCGVDCVAPHVGQIFAPPEGWCSSAASVESLDTTLGIAQEEASTLTNPEACESMGWCYNWGYMPGVEKVPYMPVLTGIAPSADECPPAVDAEGNLLLLPGTDLPLPSQWVPFVWDDGAAGGGATDDGLGGDWFGYQCNTRVEPVVTGWEGPDCNPIEFGYPSACGCFDDANCTGTCADGACSETASSPCACNPTGGATCPAGRTCIEGGCLLACESDSDCGPHRSCVDGGCAMENGVPFAEQVVWRMRNVEAPIHAVASYSLNKLIVSALLGVGISIGAKYKIFRKWREKTLWSFNDAFPLLELPFVKHQLGLEATYQDDCDATLGTMYNHQPIQVTRPVSLPNGTSSFELVEWCKPSLEANVTNPPSPDDPGDVIGAGLEDTHNWGYELGLEFWERHQLCIDGVPYYEYLQSMLEDPASVWGLLECTYYGAEPSELACDGPDELLGSLMTAMGCLDVEGPFALPMNFILAQVLADQGLLTTYTYSYVPSVGGSPSGPPRDVLDWAALFLDMEELIVTSNIDPTIIGLNGVSPGFPLPPFILSSWMAQLNLCLNDADEGGRYVDDDLELVIGIDESDLGPCDDPCDSADPDPDLCPTVGGCCRPDGGCSYGSKSACISVGGSFQPGVACPELDCPTVSGGGACCTPNGCLPVAEAKDCDAMQGAYQPGKSCADIFDCQGTGACCGAAGCSETTGTECTASGGQFTANATCPQVGNCQEPTGACCMPDGGCNTVAYDACVAAGGAFSLQADCGQPGFCGGGLEGACCLPDGCGVTSATDCLAAISQLGAGAFHPGASCSEIECVAQACCLPSGECTVASGPTCQAAGGALPGWDICAPGLDCPSTSDLHACCMPTGACSDLTLTQCNATGGTTAPGSSCSDSTTQCTGFDIPSACCMPQFGCAELVPEQCTQSGGVTHPGLACGAVDCPIVNVTGACCHGGMCSQTSNKHCAEISGVFHPNTACEDVKCLNLSGACCLHGECAQQTQSQCDEMGELLGIDGLFYAGMHCNEVPCESIGACCFENGQCAETTGSSCAKQSGNFTKDATCNEVDCCPDKLTQACCVDGQCYELPGPYCRKLGGTKGGAPTCDEATCCGQQPSTVACCLNTGCVELPADACGLAGGIAGGPGTVCSGLGVKGCLISLPLEPTALQKFK